MPKVCQRATGKAGPWGVKAAVLAVVVCAGAGPLWAQSALEYMAQQSAVQSAAQPGAVSGQGTTVVQPLIPPPEVETPEVIALTKKAKGLGEQVKSLFIDPNGKVIWWSVAATVALVFVLLMMH